VTATNSDTAHDVKIDALKMLRFSCVISQQMVKRGSQLEEFNGIKTDIFSAGVMDMIQFLMPQLEIHKHELLI
jgi:hypothetical protein